MPLTVEQFTERLELSGIMPHGSVRELIEQNLGATQPSDGEQLARDLIKQKKLTKFQAEQLYAGKGSSLVLGNYVILDKLGQGGMGVVLKAEHKRLKRLVAIKVMSPAAVKTPDALKRFHREVEAAAKLRHPNVVATDDADEAKGTHFLVMEYVDGSDLSVLVKKHGPLPVEQVVRCIIQAARGLQFAHEQGVIHRDIKPANLLIDAKGTVKILDMGLARIEGAVGGSSEGAGLTNTGTIMGTVDYMSPEQAMDTKHADARSDIYSLGCSLYYLLNGKAVYDGDTMMKKLMAHQHAAIPSLVGQVFNLPGQNSKSGQVENLPHDGDTTKFSALNSVFQRMVAKRPEDRPQSMAEVIAELERCQAGGSSTAVLTSPSSSGSGDELQQFLRDISGDSATRATSGGSGAKPVKTKSKTAVAEDSAVQETMISSAGEAGTDPRTDQTLTIEQSGEPRGVSPRTVRELTPAGSLSAMKKKKLLIGAVTAGVLLLASVIFVIKSNRGTLRVEINDSQIEVTVTGTGIVVKDEGVEDVRVTPGEHTLHVKRGDLEFETDKFELKKGETVAVQVALVGRRVRAMRGKELLGYREMSKANGATTETAKTGKSKDSAEKKAAFDWLFSVGATVNAVNIGPVTSTAAGLSQGNSPFQIDFPPRPISEAELAHLSALPSIVSLSFSNCDIGDKEVARIADLPQLTLLVLSGTKLTDRGVLPLLKRRSMYALHLERTRVTADGLATIGQLSELGDLNLNHLPVTDQSLMQLQKLRLLKSLGLSGCGELTDACGAVLAQFPSLDFLDAGRTLIGDRALQDLSKSRTLRSMSLGHCQQISDECGIALAQFPALEILNAIHTPLGDRCLQGLSQSKSLKTLAVDGTQISDASVPSLSQMKSLISLHISGTKFTADGVKQLVKAMPWCEIQSDHGVFKATEATAATKALDWLFSVGAQVGVGQPGANTPVNSTAEALASGKPVGFVFLAGRPISDKDLDHLSALPSIHSLGLAVCEIGDQGMLRIGELPQLGSLDLSGTKVTDRGLLPLLKCRSLHILHLGQTPVTSEGLATIGQLSELAELDLSYLPVTDQSLMQLQNLKLLSTLRLNECVKLTDEFGPALGQLPALATLDASRTGIGKRTLQELSKLPNLAHLNLSNCQGLTDECGAVLAQFPILYGLNVSGTPMGDRALQDLSKSRSLTILEIANTPATNAAISSLSQMKSLTALGLTNTKFTADGVKQLVKAMPWCDIHSDHGLFKATEAVSALTVAALEFDGVDDYVDLPLVLKENRPFTVEAWIRMPFDVDADRAYSIITDNSGSESRGFGLAIWNKTPHFGVNWGRPVPAEERYFAFYREARLGQSAHIAGVFDGEQARIYVNGQKGANLGQQAGGEKLTGRTILIGARHAMQANQQIHFFQGTLREVRLSSGARYTEEFIPSNRFAQDQQTLALYHCDEGSGDVLKDSSGNNHHGKIVGAKWVGFANATIATPVVTKSIDLLPLVDLKRDVIAGEWSITADGLAVKQLSDWNNEPRIQLPYQPPEEYDFEVEFTSVSGKGHVEQLLSSQSRSFAWLMNSVLQAGIKAGLETIDGTSLISRTDGTVMKPKLLENGPTRYRSRVEVRKRSLRAFLNDERLVDWGGDFNRLDIAKRNALRDTLNLGLAVNDRGVTFHKIAVREVTGTGKLVAKTAGASSDREAADWVLSKQGKVTVQVPDAQGKIIGREVSAAAGLPQGEVVVTGIRFPSDVQDIETSLTKLAGLSQLTSLHLDHAIRLSDANATSLANFKNLQYLHVAVNGITAAGLASLGQLPNLEVLFLDMKGQPITDKELPRLLALTRLKEFHLFTSNIDDAHYRPLLDMPNLVTLVIFGGQLTDRVIADLEKKPRLTGIGLCYCALTSDGIRSLAKLRHLTSLQLVGSPCSDADLEHLAALTKLTNLSLRQTKVTATGVAALQKALANCKIEWDDPSNAK